MKNSTLLACGALLLLSNAARASALTHSCVNPGATSGCFATIQAAIDAGGSALAIDVAAGSYAAFIVSRGTSASVSGAGPGLTFIDADHGPAAATVNGGQLTLTAVTVRNAESGILAGDAGRVTLDDVEIVGCPANGVRVQDGARLAARGLRVSGSISGIFAWRGARARVSDGRFNGNAIGIDVQDSSLELSDSRIVRNQTGISAALSKKVVVRRSRIAGNTVAGLTLFGRPTKATISDSSVVNNGDGPLSTALDANALGRLRIERSTIASNPGTGVSTSARSMAIIASTIAGNDVGLRVLQRFDRRGDLTVDNSTIATNGTGIDCRQSESCGSFAGTIVADSITSDCEGRITTRGYNLIEDASSCDVTPLATDLTGVDPHLGPLADDGHLTDTKPLLPGSPAIDAVDGRFCRGTDQRGLRRGRPCDVGAYEAGAQ